jgi:hypothetical protein
LVAVTGARDRGVKESDFAVLRLAQTPAVLINVGVLSNPEEAANLAGEEYQERLAKGLAEGLLAYLRSTQGTTRAYEIVIVDQPVGELLPDTSLVLPFPDGSDDGDPDSVGDG